MEKKLKIAVGFGGMYRTFDYTFKLSEREFLPYETDYYFSTWNTSFTEREHIEEFEVTDEMITNVIPNVNYEIIDEFILQGMVGRIGCVDRYLYHLRNILIMIKESKKEYDFVILTRPDIVITCLNQFMNQIIEKGLDKCLLVNQFYYIPNNELWYSGDFIFGGTYDNLKRFFLMLTWGEPHHNSHHMFGHYLNRLYDLEKIVMYSQLGLRRHRDIKLMLKGEEINNPSHIEFLKPNMGVTKSKYLNAFYGTINENDESDFYKLIKFENNIINLFTYKTVWTNFSNKPKFSIIECIIDLKNIAHIDNPINYDDINNFIMSNKPRYDGVAYLNCVGNEKSVAIALWNKDIIVDVRRCY